MNVPDHLKYLDSHEWVDPTNAESFRVGISDHAQAELTEIVFLELPPPGKVVAKGDPVAVVESVKAANDIYAPVSGEIIAINKPLEETPNPVNDDPFGEGWMFDIRPSDPSELESLMNAAAYREHIA